MRGKAVGKVDHMCMGTVSSSVFLLTVILVTDLKSRNGKTAKAPEVLIAADISSGSRFSFSSFLVLSCLYFAFFLPSNKPFCFPVCPSHIVFYVCVGPKQDIMLLNPTVLIRHFIAIRQKYATAF